MSIRGLADNTKKLHLFRQQFGSGISAVIASKASPDLEHSQCHVARHSVFLPDHAPTLRAVLLRVWWQTPLQVACNPKRQADQALFNAATNSKCKLRLNVNVQI